jgi:TolB-like protein/Flp pilus assembly protein TadD
VSRYFDELKRRNVFRVAAAYAVVGWLAIEVIDTLAPRMGMPEWVPGFVILLVLIGFPIALLFSWAFEMTPEGIKKTAEVDVDQSITSTTGQKINYVIIAALAAVVLLQQFSPSLSKISPFSEAADDAEPIGIAILPFADLSPQGDQEYLGDGVAEEILNVLAGVDGLKVTSRTSAFAFKEQNRPIPEIANILGVSHVVEGSIRKQADRVRITAQLIDVADDSHLWSETYDSDLSDIFRLQDEIAAQISSALSTSLDLSLPAVVRETRDWNVRAYELYLRARQLVVARTAFEKAVELLDAATRLEPEFADAWAEKATALALVAFDLSLDDETIDRSYETYDQAWQAARHAADIEPRHPLALAAQGLIRMQQKRWIEARVYLDRALDVHNPNDYAFLWLAILQSTTGDKDGALATFEAGLKLSPTAPNLIRYRQKVLALQGRWRQIWEQGVGSAAMDMEQTLFLQQVAGLQLGEINVDNFGAWVQAETTQSETGASAPIIALARSMFGDAQVPIPVTEMFYAQESWTQQAMALIQPDLVQTYFQLNLAPIRAAPHRNDLELLWTKGAEQYRDSNEFFELVRDVGLPPYWELYGWPDMCWPTGVSDFECD